jgi:putative acetyltransferase
MLSIRPSTFDDRDVLFGLWRDSVVATHDFLMEEDFEYYAHLFREHYLPNFPVWTAVDQDGPAGFIGLTGQSIDTLFVAPSRFRQGVGRALMAHAKGLAPRLRVQVNEQNPRAIDFYASEGFQPVGRTPTDDNGRPYPILYLAWTAEETLDMHVASAVRAYAWSDRAASAAAEPRAARAC